MVQQTEISSRIDEGRLGRIEYIGNHIPIWGGKLYFPCLRFYVAKSMIKRYSKKKSINKRRSKYRLLEQISKQSSLASLLQESSKFEFDVEVNFSVCGDNHDYMIISIHPLLIHENIVKVAKYYAFWKCLKFNVQWEPSIGTQSTGLFFATTRTNCTSLFGGDVVGYIRTMNAFTRPIWRLSNYEIVPPNRYYPMIPSERTDLPVTVLIATNGNDLTTEGRVRVMAEYRFQRINQTMVDYTDFILLTFYNNTVSRNSQILRADSRHVGIVIHSSVPQIGVGEIIQIGVLRDFGVFYSVRSIRHNGLGCNNYEGYLSVYAISVP